MSEDVVLVDILDSVVSSMGVFANFQPGWTSQILRKLVESDESIEFKDYKYPLIAMLMPVSEVRGSVGYYSNVRIEKIVIATLTDSTDDVLTRYKDGGTFKSILYPCYNEFLRCLANSPNVVALDKNTFKHTKRDVPGVQPIGQGVKDYIDAIEILNLEIILNQIKTC